MSTLLGPLEADPKSRSQGPRHTAAPALLLPAHTLARLPPGTPPHPTPPTPPPKQVIDFPEADGPLEFSYDPEWLAVLRATHGLLSLQRRPAPLPREAPPPSAEELAEVGGLRRGRLAGLLLLPAAGPVGAGLALVDAICSVGHA